MSAGIPTAGRLIAPPRSATRRGILVVALAFASLAGAADQPAKFNVRKFGATGDGRTLETVAINAAIQAAAGQGGGTVVFPAGSYLSYSIHLRSHVVLELTAGATLIAADPASDLSAGYDAPEPNSANDAYQDFGHSHWHNSLIWAEDAEGIGIVGQGKIYGRGLSRGNAWALRDNLPEERSGSAEAMKVVAEKTKMPANSTGAATGDVSLPAGVGNKAIAFKNCRNVTLQDFTIYHGGHFGILATGVDHLTVQRLRIDSNRDGMDLDNCRNARVTACLVNTPYDDGICIKSSRAVGAERCGSEDITVSDCHVSGYEEGTMLDGTYRRGELTRSVPTGRIKCGTESNGPMRNIAVTNCTFDYSRGLALESVDGSIMEDITISNLAMRDITNAPIFIRLGARLRGPADTVPGAARRIKITNVIAHQVAATSGILIAGLTAQPIEDISLDHIFIDYAGGGTAAQAARVVPEYEKEYPDPKTFGTIPAWGLWARHVKGLSVSQVEFRTAAADARPAIGLEDTSGVRFEKIQVPHATGAFRLRNVTGFEWRAGPALANQTHPERVVEATY